MACGFTPDLLRMLEAAGDGKHKAAARAEEELAQTTQQLEAARRRAELVAEQTAGRRDWTAVYEKWDAWEDPEELAQREQQVRDKHERAAKAAAAAGCNHDHSAEQKLMDMTTRQKLDASREFKVFGNRFFRQGQFERAAYHYHKALVYFEYIFPESADEDSEMDRLKLSTLLNFATARLKTGHWDDVLHHAKLAREMQGDNARALYLLACAYRQRHEYELAVAMMSQLEQLNETGSEVVDKSVAEEKRILQAEMLAYKRKSKSLSRAMFAGDATQGESDRTSALRGVARVRDVPLQLSTTAIVGSPAAKNDSALLDTSVPYVVDGDDLVAMIDSIC